jgi:putative membrane protein
MGWWMAFGGLLWLMMWGAFIYVIVKVSDSGRDAGGGSRNESLEIVRRRYAAGEITKAQYEELRSDLSSRAA